jgi:hypothetical protein
VKGEIIVNREIRLEVFRLEVFRLAELLVLGCSIRALAFGWCGHGGPRNSQHC